MVSVHGGSEFKPAAWPRTQKTRKLPLQDVGLEADVQPLVAAFDGKAGGAARRDDAGPVRVDGHPVPADGCFTLAGHGRQQAEAISLRIVDDRAEIAGAVDEREVLKLDQVSLSPEVWTICNLGPARAEPVQESVPELFGIVRLENRKPLKRIGVVLDGGD